MDYIHLQIKRGGFYYAIGMHGINKAKHGLPFFIFAAHKEEMRNMPKSLDIP